MEELRAIALAYYSNGSGNMKETANKFFKSMDEDGDQKIRLGEYLAFMRKLQDVVDLRMCNPGFFNYLKEDESAYHLSFADVLTLFYIIQTERRFCDACGVFLVGLYFTCAECFPLEKSRYSVCFECYRDKIFVHDHSGPLLDNNALLIVMNESNLEKNKTNELRTTETGASSSMAIVPASSSHGRSPVPKIAKVALKTVELAVNIGSAISNCSIM
ncbi:hypothetical protein F0562_000574 [Nyssa sinensis]|uniref:EF-hand domain-containing protein n=1 Tax=Nyssa sinensis TaxID=561372 RepID=A0A5J5C435_9ASTE|nr:hypothetical protein F0562_000574 [Nyssa sinensis]